MVLDLGEKYLLIIQVAIFIDDINMPSVEEYGAQPPIEMLRLLVDKGGVYDRKERYWK